MERMTQETYEQLLYELMYNHYRNLEVNKCYCYEIGDYGAEIIFSDWFEDPLFPTKTEFSLFRLNHDEIMCVVTYKTVNKSPTVFTIY